MSVPAVAGQERVQLGRFLVWPLTGLLGIAALAVWSYVGTDSASPALRMAWPALALLFAVAEGWVLHVELGQNAHSFSFSEIPLVLGLYLATPHELVLAQLVGSAIALQFLRRQPARKLAFNLAHFALESGLAVLVFRALAPGAGPAGAQGWLAALMAVVVVTVCADIAVFCAITLSEQEMRLGSLPGMLGPSLLAAAANTALALLVVRALGRDPFELVLLSVPLLMLYGAYRAHQALQEQYHNVSFLHECSSMLLTPEPLEFALRALLARARDGFRADVAELTLFPASATEQLLRSRANGHETQMLTALADGKEGQAFVALAAPRRVRAAVVDRKPSTLSRRRDSKRRPVDDQDHELADYLRSRGLRDGMVAPLRGERRLLGAVLLANRAGDVARFTRGDIGLFETFANQLAAALVKERLERSLEQLAKLQEQLRHQALHDPLTGLANRKLFAERVEQALSHPTDDRHVIVLFVDIDDFADVNDSLGHMVGDQLLVDVAGRLRRSLSLEDTAARLGGDEFGVLVHERPPRTAGLPAGPDGQALAVGGAGGAAPALDLVERVMAALSEPFVVLDRKVHVQASIGAALAEPRTMIASELLRNADTAMSYAKRAGKATSALYRPEMLSRLAQSTQRRRELQRAVELSQFEIHYQPLVELDDERLVGVEALVRWRHPRLGVLRPDAFIPLAEECGLVPAIGGAVLRTACKQAAAWRRQHGAASSLWISVNLSASQLSNNLIVEVDHALADAGLDPGCLILEVTESVLMRDTERSLAHLRNLKALGVRVALDDFGTGYSSLAYLQRFPIDILKIAKDFIDGLGTRSDAGVLVEAVLDLGATLGLCSLAEGIEHQRQRDRLRQMRCALGQGYLFSPPLRATGIEGLLRQNELGARVRQRHEAPDTHARQGV